MPYSCDIMGDESRGWQGMFAFRFGRVESSINQGRGQ